ncbi:unnamed protein product [Mycena citricolor]|uniref:Uncharacterized protein n=1 Tax=Mycena citricolor TaxID=2018698 RepID=A0AAD2HA94_9AGAR|nr:unnamed protein product [Mycena citricolor]
MQTLGDISSPPTCSLPRTHYLQSHRLARRMPPFMERLKRASSGIGMPWDKTEQPGWGAIETHRALYENLTNPDQRQAQAIRENIKKASMERGVRDLSAGYAAVVDAVAGGQGPVAHTAQGTNLIWAVLQVVQARVLRGAWNPSLCAACLLSPDRRHQACFSSSIFRHLNVIFNPRAYGTVMGPMEMSEPGLKANFVRAELCPGCPPGKRASRISRNIAEIVLGPDNMQDWDFAEHLASMDIIDCPYRCGESFDLATSPTLRGKPAVQVQCLRCRGYICKACRCKWHEGLLDLQRVPVLPMHRQSIGDREFLELIERESWKRCPKCRQTIERQVQHHLPPSRLPSDNHMPSQYGCNHMTCVCGHHVRRAALIDSLISLTHPQFCYACGADFAQVNGRFRCSGTGCKVWPWEQKVP